MNLAVTAQYDERDAEIALKIENSMSQRIAVIVRDGYSGRQTDLLLEPGEVDTRHWSLSRTRGWYDLVITVPADPDLEYRYAGHLETGEDSISDPRMGGLV